MSIAVHKFGGVKNRIHNEQRIDGSPVTNIMPGRYEISKLTQRKALKYQIRLEYPTRWLSFSFISPTGVALYVVFGDQPPSYQLVFAAPSHLIVQLIKAQKNGQTDHPAQNSIHKILGIDTSTNQESSTNWRIPAKA